MRNLKEYPLTTEECIAVLTGMKEAMLQQELIGDMRPLVLQKAIELFERRKLLEDELKERLRFSDSSLYDFKCTECGDIE